MIDMLAPITVSTEDLESRREVVTHKPFVHIASIPGIYLLAMLRSIIMNMVYSKKQELGLSTTCATGTIMLKDQSSNLGSFGFDDVSGSFQFSHSLGVVFGPCARIGIAVLTGTKSILRWMGATYTKSHRDALRSNAAIISGSRFSRFLKLLGLMFLLPATLYFGTFLTTQLSWSGHFGAIDAQSKLLVFVILAFPLVFHVFLQKGGGLTAWNSPR